MIRFVPEPEQCIAIASTDDQPDALAYNAAFAVLYGGGMFVCELLDLRPIDILGGERTRVEIVGSRARTVPLPKGTADRLALLFGAVGPRPNDVPIFRAAPLSIGLERIAKELKRRSIMIGLPRPLLPRDLRIAF